MINAPKFKEIERTTLTVLESASYLGISKDLMYQLCREKKVPHFKIGSRILLKREKLDEWMEQQFQTTMENEY